jgi:zinc transport system substrate-binding protein
LKPSRRLAAIALSLLSAALPRIAAQGRDASAPVVAVSILPQAYFVDRISGGAFKALVLVGPGQSPHSYEPSPRQMAELSKAAAWLSVGLEFEKGLKPKIASLYPKLRIEDTSSGVRFRALEAHFDEGAFEEGGGPDPHFWLGRQGSEAMAESICGALSEIDPAGAKGYAARLAALKGDIEAAFSSLSPVLAPMRGRTIIVFHPAFGYFLDEFGIRQEAVEAGGKEPTQKALAALMKKARDEEAKVVFVQAQFPTSAALTLAKAIGGVVEPMDDLAPDWLANIARMGNAIRKALK